MSSATCYRRLRVSIYLTTIFKINNKQKKYEALTSLNCYRPKIFAEIPVINFAGILENIFAGIAVEKILGIVKNNFSKSRKWL